ncbi:MAG: Ppx/GppA family phosphatase [Solirubrobacteraceae bacterium]|nr:Ppx/GppA family phosphatase [Solirubrobacteraceae bacterium]
MPDPQRTAVIDLGSNSFRLVVFSAGPAFWRRSDEIFEQVRIGEHVGKDGRLGRKQMDRALDTIDVFAHFCRATKIAPERIRAVATSAIRDATNRDKFVEAAEERSGLRIEVLSREEEARYGYLAAVNSTTLRDGVVLDLGGGSMQLVRTRDRTADKLASWPLGAVRMTERFLEGDAPAQPEALEALREHVRTELRDGASWLPKAGDRIVGIGGTVRNLGAATQAAAELPSMGVQGFAIQADALDALVERLAALPPAERRKVRGIKPARADVILAGAVVVQTVLREGGFDALEVTEAGLREGVFFSEHNAEHDPPLFPDIRRESVLNLAAQYQVDPAHTAHVGALALGIFDALADSGVFPGDPVERQLLWAACMLHDIGMRVDYDDHHKHSRYLILNAGLPGYSPIEVAMIAQAARYHRKGMPDLDTFRKLSGPGDDRRLDRLAVLLRLGEDLERSRDQSVTAARVSADDETVRLTLEADEGIDVARWAAEREVELFGRAFERKLKIEV